MQTIDHHTVQELDDIVKSLSTLEGEAFIDKWL
jgi:hypothetical protein